MWCVFCPNAGGSALGDLQRRRATSRDFHHRTRKHSFVHNQRWFMFPKSRAHARRTNIKRNHSNQPSKQDEIFREPHNRTAFKHNTYVNDLLWEDGALCLQEQDGPAEREHVELIGVDAARTKQQTQNTSAATARQRTGKKRELLRQGWRVKGWNSTVTQLPFLRQ